MKFFYQPGGEKGIIRWSLLLIFFMLGIIAQLEIFKTNIIAPIIMTIAGLTVLWFVIKSYLRIENQTIIISDPLKQQTRIISLQDVKSTKNSKYYLVLNFKSTEFFPLRIIALPSTIKKISTLINK